MLVSKNSEKYKKYSLLACNFALEKDVKIWSLKRDHEPSYLHAEKKILLKFSIWMNKNDTDFSP